MNPFLNTRLNHYLLESFFPSTIQQFRQPIFQNYKTTFAGLIKTHSFRSVTVTHENSAKKNLSLTLLTSTLLLISYAVLCILKRNIIFTSGINYSVFKTSKK